MGYSDDFIDKNKSITIKAYDYMEKNLEGTIKIPVQIGLAIIETTCQLLDLEFPYNLLLGRPWIHALKLVPSTFHQFLKFHYDNKEVTIYVDTEPFHYYAKLEEKYKNILQIPSNEYLSTPFHMLTHHHYLCPPLHLHQLSSLKPTSRSKSLTKAMGNITSTNPFALGYFPQH